MVEGARGLAAGASVEFWASRSADQLPIVKAIGADESWRALAAWLIIAGRDTKRTH